MAIVLLTGASSGLGAALAPLLAADGDRVALAARRADALEAVVEQIRSAGGEALAVPLDVTDRDAVQAAVAQVAEVWGPVETLVANAGVGFAVSAEAYDSGTVERIFAVNVLGLSHCVEAVLPGMLAAGAGHIVGVGSLAGYRGLPGSAPYCASKAAVRLLLEGLRVELRSKGVAVTHIAPGFVETPLTARNDFEMPFLLPVEEGARHLYTAIRKRPAEYAFPWQLKTAMGLGRMLPAGLWDRAMSGRKAEKSEAIDGPGDG